MGKSSLVGILLLFLVCNVQSLFAQDKTISDATKDMQSFEGYFDFHYDEAKGKVWLVVDKLDTEFLYVNSLTGGVGSNDIGLDRNQLGSSRVVKFVKMGNKLMMIQPNYSFRAVSNNEDESKSVEQAFAQSNLWGFDIAAKEGDKMLIDLTPFLLRDAHGVANRMRSQGNYKVDAKRSAINIERTKNFPLNSEFDAMITFSGDARGRNIRSVTPTSSAVTVFMHHSFVQLPDDNYTPRVFDPRSGYYANSYQDYATPIDQPLMKRFLRRHRLEKKDPSAAVSEAVEPIVYYLDRGAPEPIRSALLEGASWWNQAYEAAGYKDAFQVKVLPEDADPMDVRYNVINWVHRSTRGWSYGSSVSDPRTGEIIKGHVLLGSLRVRQDFMIAQGLVEAYEDGTIADPRLLEMALARLRQLSAHEVGHTLGLVHNFAASVNDRASVMDYPHPMIKADGLGRIDFSESYAVGIGEWDKRTIIFGYQDFPEGTDEAEALDAILKDNIKMGFHFMSDSDSRPPSGAHPLGHLWDNGASAADELRRMSDVRRIALNNFSEKNIPVGAPMATLENVLVPLYLSPRYQIEAVSKVIGGVNYTYAARGDGQVTNQMVDDAVQRDALDALLSTLKAGYLVIPEEVIKLIPPQPMGYSRGRELFKVHTGLTFDPLGAAESMTNHAIGFLMNPARMARLVEQHARNSNRLSAYETMSQLFETVGPKREYNSFENEIGRMTEKWALHHTLLLAGDQDAMRQVSATAMLKVNEMDKKIDQEMNYTQDPAQLAHLTYMQEQINMFRKDPKEYQVPKIQAMPDGSPIGCGGHF
ncbi:MAG: zinc-dependent metalloprotease [Bacteroidota bacterium]